jgi:hypothetical protein
VNGVPGSLGKTNQYFKKDSSLYAQSPQNQGKNAGRIALLRLYSGYINWAYKQYLQFDETDQMRIELR